MQEKGELVQGTEENGDKRKERQTESQLISRNRLERKKGEVLYVFGCRYYMDGRLVTDHKLIAKNYLQARLQS